MQPVLRALRPYRKELIIGPAFKFTEAVLELIVPLLVGQMIDVGLAQRDSDAILHYGLLSLLLAVIGMACAYVCQYQASLASQGYGTDLRNQLMTCILDLSSSDVQRFGTASLTARITSDIQVLQQAVAMLIRLVVRAPFLSVGSLIMVYYVNPKLTILFALALVLFVGILTLIMWRLLPLFRRLQQLTDRLIARLIELLSGIRVIRAVARHREKAKQYQDINDDLTRLMRRIGRISALMNPLTLLTLNATAIALLLLGAREVRLGNLQTGQIIALINYLGMMLTALTVVANLVILYTRAYASAIRVSEVLKTSTRNDQQGQADRSLLESAGELAPAGTINPTLPAQDADTLRFEHVSFTFPEASKPLFRDLSFSLPHAKTLGIIGPTGAGKSALAALIENRYPLDAGRIYLDGEPIDNWSERELLTRVHVVPQRSNLFAGSIRANLLLGLNADCPDERIWQALCDAQAADFVEQLEEGLDSQVERGGRNFSGGQKQRLCIARALLRQPRLLVFDDSSSALDYATDAALQQALHDNPAYARTTVITISQRIAAVRRADLILLLDQGVCLGFGTHHELMEQSELYREIYHSQIENERELIANHADMPASDRNGGGQAR